MKAADLQAITLDAVTSPILRAGHAYWLEKCAGRAFPAREDLDPPIEIPRLCGHIILFAVRHAPLDFEYRLIGDGIRRRLGENLAGRCMSQVPHQAAPNIMWKQHAWVVEHGQPRFFRPEYLGEKEDFAFIEAAVLPLGQAPDQVDGLMCFGDFLPAR
jgi:hypothetical protein